MTFPLTTDDIANMREAQGIHAYTDTAYYIPAPDLSNLDEYGQPTPAATETLMTCAFVDTGKAENWRDADIEQLDAEIYFSSLTPVKGGKVRTASRFGQAVASRTYEIVGIQDRGAFGWVCALKVVTI